MDDNLNFLFIAFLITWIAIAGYLFSLNRQAQSLREEVAMLREERQSHDS